jgi:hypothetical protein
MAVSPDGKPFDFVYYVYSEALVGSLNGESFVLTAYSGGGRGRAAKSKGRPEYSLASFSTRRGTDTKRDVRGGPLPPGRWSIGKPSDYKGKMKRPVAKLTPIGNQVVEYSTREFTEKPFLIHGSGEQGSDGCIVVERVERERLLRAVESAGGAILLVTMELTGDDLFSRALRGRSMA